MKIAFLSDIHGNAVALEAVLADLDKRQVDKVCVLGDLAYRGPEPKRAIALVRSLSADVIKGNADEWTIRGVRLGEVPAHLLEMMNREREWIVERLDEDDLAYLRKLPEALSLPLGDSLHLHAFHATPHSLFDVVTPDQSRDVLREKLMADEAANLYVYAHIHLPYVRYVNGKCVVNVGSVGLPFDGLPQASYAIVETDGDRFRVTIERVPYDVEAVIRQYREGDYPNLEKMTRVVREAVSPFG